MCRKALLGQPANSHLDDLESFYWVLCFIICSHHGPGLSSSQLVLSPEMKLLVTADCESAARSKRLHFSGPFELPLASFWGRSVLHLMRNLHIFFRNRILAQETAHKLGLDPPPNEPGADYTEFSGYFSLAIQELMTPEPDNAVCMLLTPVMDTIETKQYSAGFPRRTRKRRTRVCNSPHTCNLDRLQALR